MEVNAVRVINRDPDHDPSAQVFYSDAVEANGMLFVSGCVPYDDNDELVGAGDPELQVAQTLDNLGKTLSASGYEFSDLVKLNIYLTDIRDVPATLAPRRERFGASTRPATTLVEVSALLAPGVRVEIEAIAVKQNSNTPSQA